MHWMERARPIHCLLDDSHLVVHLRLDLTLVVAACANRATRGGNALDERVSTQHGTNAMVLTEVEAHCSIRICAAHSTLYTTSTTDHISVAYSQPEWCSLLRCGSWLIVGVVVEGTHTTWSAQAVSCWASITPARQWTCLGRSRVSQTSACVGQCPRGKLGRKREREREREREAVVSHTKELLRRSS